MDREFVAPTDALVLRVEDPGAAGSVAAVSRWVTGPMVLLNREILAGSRPGSDFAAEVERVVLPDLGAPEGYRVGDAQRLVVLLGLLGAGLGRHFQERGVQFRHCPEQAFGLRVGPDQATFLDWFARLAQRTGTGHPPRDTYASLTRWNLPTSEVRWAGRCLARLPGVFDDGLVRTYTGEPDEVRFFELIKLTETLERAVNQTLEPLGADQVDLRGEEAVHRLGVSTVLLEAMRQLNADFASRPPERGLRHGHFMDVFRQFAVHWRPGDVPPSGALDPEAIERDLVLGIDPPGYREHVDRLFPGLLDAERARLRVVLDRPSIPALLLARSGVTEAGLAQCTAGQLRTLVGAVPALAATHLLLTAHARMSGVHLRLGKKFLFGPQRARDRTGIGDTGVVSNRTGTTGMDESALERLTRNRRNHLLHPLAALPTAELEAITGLTRIRAATSPDLRGLVRFVGVASVLLDDAAAQGRPARGLSRLVRPRDGSEAPTLVERTGEQRGSNDR